MRARVSKRVVLSLLAASLAACSTPEGGGEGTPCSADADCDSAEECNNGLCQQACGGADDVDCPTSAPLCLNGYCSSVCPLSEEFDDVCPPPQTCTSLTLPGEEPGDSGVCTVACDDETAPCPDGQVCFADFGVCVAVCMSADDCASGEDCTGGFCVPSSSGAP